MCLIPQLGPKPPEVSDHVRSRFSGEVPGVAAGWLDGSTSLIFNQASHPILLGKSTRMCAA